MNYRPFLDEYDGKSPSQIKTTLFQICDTIIQAILSFDPNKDIFEGDFVSESIYYGALTISFADNSYDEKEIKFINDLRAHLNLNNIADLTVSDAKFQMKTEYDCWATIVCRYYQMLQQVSDNHAFYDVYSKIIGEVSLSELFLKFLCGVVAINGDIDESEVEFLDGVVNGSFNAVPEGNNSEANISNDSNDYGDVQDFSNNYQDNPEPTVIKIGGSLYKTEYSTYFSVGAEIAIEGQDVASLDIRVQLLDSEGFILESFDERIRWVERGVFHFGKEYSIDCSPSNFKIIVGARERGDLEDNYCPSKVFKVTGMRFTRNTNSYSDNYRIACMVENVLSDSLPEADVYVVFYDDSDNIVGGACLSGNSLYRNQTDRYDTSIDCKSVVNKTRTFRWTCDMGFYG